MLSRIFAGLVLLAVGLFMLLVLIPFGIRASGDVQPNSLSPQGLPTFLAWGVIVVSIGIIVAGGTVGGQQGMSLGAVSLVRTVAFCAAFAGLLLFLPIIGTAPAVFIFVGGLLSVKSQLSVWRSILYAALFTFAVQILFIELAGIPLPDRLPNLF